MTFETLLIETHDTVRLIRLNRPEALNALNRQLIAELTQALSEAEQDEKIGCTVLTGSDKAFAAGADIREMQDFTFPQTYLDDFIGAWDAIGQRRKPMVVAVAGFALGGGCEIALMGDVLLAADTAKFGQPEIKLGIMPGAGGTQRLTRAIGKAKAMDLCLTGRMMDAQEAERAGLVARIVPAADLLPQALATAQVIAGYSRTAVMMTKESIDRVDDTMLSEGLRVERRLFQSLFATQDQKEGMAAFVAKRAPSFQNR